MTARRGRWEVVDGRWVRLCGVEVCRERARHRPGKGYEQFCAGHEQRAYRIRRGRRTYVGMDAPLLRAESRR